MTVRAVVVSALLALAFASVSAAAPPLSVRASLDRRAVAFGGPVHARVVVRLDPARADPASLWVSSDLAPLTVLSESRSARSGPANTLVVTLDRTAVCLVAGCLGRERTVVPRLASVETSASDRRGGTIRQAAAWPSLRILARVSAVGVSRARPPFRADTTVPAPAYAVAPAALAALLDGGAALLGLAGAWLALREVLRIRRPGRVAEVDELARAMTLAQESLARSPDDRRRALALLSRVLGRHDGALANSANDLAWSRQAPEAPEMTSLAGEVRKRVGP